MTNDTLISSDSGRPMKKSAPSGVATSAANQVPMLTPVIRRTTSPMRYPWVTAWYPEAVPGSHHGSWAASNEVQRSQSASCSGSRCSVQPHRPAVWLIRWRTSIAPLPPVANSGQ